MKIVRRIIPVFVVLLYIIFFGRNIFPEISLLPAWIRNINTEEGLGIKNATGSFPFKVSGKFGYFLSDGTILYHDNVLYDVALDREGFINYSSINTHLVLKNSAGSITGMISTSGYPVFKGSKRFIISSDENMLTEIDEQGAKRWYVNFNSIITDVFATEKYLLVSTVNDGAVLWGPKNEKIFTYNPVTSRINTVYGSAVSTDGSHLVSVSGIDPQVFVLFSRKNSHYNMQYTFQFDKTLRHQLMCGFSRDGEYALVERAGRIVLVDVRKKRVTNFPFSGNLQLFDLEGEGKLLFIITAEKENVSLSAYKLTGERAFSFSLPGKELFFKKDGPSVYLGASEHLMKLVMVEK